MTQFIGTRYAAIGLIVVCAYANPSAAQRAATESSDSPAAVGSAPPPANCGPLLWHFEEGQIHNYHLRRESSGSIRDAYHIVQEFWERWEVISVDGDNAVIEVRTDRFRVESTIGDEVATVDSDIEPASADDWHSEVLWSVAMVGQSIRIRVSSRGEVLSVTSPDDFRYTNARLAELVPTLTEDQRADFAELRERLLLVSTWHSHFSRLPDGEPDVGVEWTHDTQTPLLFDGELTRRITFEVAGETDDGIVSVDVSSMSSEYTFPDETEDFFRVTDAQLSGGFTFDRCAGALVRSEFNFAFSAQLHLPDDPTTEWRPVTMDLVTTLSRLGAEGSHTRSRDRDPDYDRSIDGHGEETELSPVE